MKVVIAGSRSIEDYNELLKAIERCPFEIHEVVSGRAPGVDSLGERYAEENNLPLHLFPADWKQFGYKAGFIRNCEMADFADAVLCVWDGESTGTLHMMKQARKRNLPLFIYEVGKDEPDLLGFLSS